MLIALVLPPLLVHRMIPDEYSVWVLILQSSAYINLLDLGMQTATSKYVAEFEAVGDTSSSSRILSSSFILLCFSGLIGAGVVSTIAWQVPQLFHQMPVILIGSLRKGILVVGLSVVLALPFGVFSAAFTGLQRYGFPTILAVGSKVLSSMALTVLLFMHGNLVQLACLMAGFNVITALSQYLGWKKYASERLTFSFQLVDRLSITRLCKYGSVASIWTVCMLFITGLDMVIVGHYDYKSTGSYGIATTVTNLMLAVLGSLFSPLLPAISALQSERTAGELGDLVIRTTRYNTLLVCLIGLPLLFGAYPLLKLWVGYDYARSSALFLQILVIGNAFRQLGNPYALAVVATGKQYLASLSGIIEALVNVYFSIYLVQRIGAVGVAIGTLVGAFVGLAIHVFVSMRLTRSAVLLSRQRFIVRGLLHPLFCILPSVLFLPLWRRSTMLPANPSIIIAWCSATIGIVYLVGLTDEERRDIKELFF